MRSNPKLEQFKKNVAGKNIAVIGIGVSNLPLIKMLSRFGANIVARDKKTAVQLADIYDELVSLGVKLVLGEGYLKDLKEQIIFKTPGMRFDLPELMLARERGCVITSEMEAFFDLCPAKIIGVTGSDGKTTTTTLIHKMLTEQGYKCWLGGNIGMPLLSNVEDIRETDKVAVELSSFQLHSIKASPHIAVVTNVTPNHLDMHKSMEEYIEAKENIFRYQRSDDKLVLNADNDITASFARKAKGRVMFFGRRSEASSGVFLQDDGIFVCDGEENIRVLNTKDILIPGKHNVENYMAAIAAVWGFCDASAIKRVATTFSGVEHRIEFVREVGDVKYYNDSIASSPTRTIAGLHSFDEKVILIAGGYDKNTPFDDLGVEIAARVRKLLLLGKTAKKIRESVENAPNFDSASLSISMCEDLRDAVETAAHQAKSGDVVMLSPACASFDMFANFEERGKMFKQLVNEL